jgi:hypothetical protein
LKEDLSVGSDMDEEDSDSNDGKLDESADVIDESMKNTADGIIGKGMNHITDNKLTKGLASGIGFIGKGLGNLAGMNQDG